MGLEQKISLKAEQFFSFGDLPILKMTPDDENPLLVRRYISLTYWSQVKNITDNIKNDG